MSKSMTEPNRQRQERHQERHGDFEPARSQRRPFDDSEIDELPRPRSDDPPYQNWWVIDARTDRVKL
jgi:hypothetical protein